MAMAICRNEMEDMGKPSDVELDEGPSSPVDCWELVDSGPSSPLPEAMADESALQAAIGAACSSGDDYFASPHNASEHMVLPFSAVMAGQQSEQEAHSSSRGDALEAGESGSRSSSISTIARIDVYNEDVTPMLGSIDMGYSDYVSHSEHMQMNDSMCHDDHPHYMFFGDGVTSLEHYKMDDGGTAIYNSEMVEHDDMLPAGNDMQTLEYVHSDEDNMIHAHASGEDAELLSTSHGMHDNSMEIYASSTEGGNFPTAGEGGSRELSDQIKSSLGVQEGRHINIHNSKHCKAFTCASWVWTQLRRWQAQLGYANTIWSVALTALVMGMLVLRRGWQRLQAQNYSLRSQLWAKEKRITQLMFQLMQTKESFAKTRRVPVICVKPALQIPQGQT